MVAVPAPWDRTATNTQPSVARVNVNSALGPEIEVALSSSATRLFRFVATGDGDVG